MEKAILTIEYQGKRVTLEADCLTTYDFRNKLLRPMMLALEFHPDSVDDIITVE